MQNISSILKRGLKFKISVRKKEVKKWSIFINQMQEHKLRGRGSHLKRFILHPDSFPMKEDTSITRKILRIW